MYRCSSCGYIFDEPMPMTEYSGVVDETGYYREHYTVGVCPACGFSTYEEVVECELCGEPTDNMDYCEDCYADMNGLVAVAFDNFQKMHPNATDEIMYDLLYLIWNEWDNEQMEKLKESNNG